MDINGRIREARERLTAHDGDWNKDVLAAHVLPQLSPDDIEQLAAEALWNRSLGISADGRRNATAKAQRYNDDEDYSPKPFGRGYLNPKPRRKRGQARAETASMVGRIVQRWLDQFSALGSSDGEKRLGEYTADEFEAMSNAKRKLAATYDTQSDADESIAKMIRNTGVDTADELPAESLYLIIKSYRPINAPDVEDHQDEQDQAAHDIEQIATGA